MKRFLILLSLIAFVTVSCAGPNKVGKPKTLEKDWKECGDSIDKNPNPEAFDKALVECLENNGYTYQTSQEEEKTKEEPTTKDRIITAGKTAGMILLGVTLTALYLALMFAPRK